MKKFGVNCFICYCLRDKLQQLNLWKSVFCFHFVFMCVSVLKLKPISGEEATTWKNFICWRQTNWTQLYKTVKVCFCLTNDLKKKQKINANNNTKFKSFFLNTNTQKIVGLSGNVIDTIASTKIFLLSIMLYGCLSADTGIGM